MKCYPGQVLSPCGLNYRDNPGFVDSSFGENLRGFGRGILRVSGQSESSEAGPKILFLPVEDIIVDMVLHLNGNIEKMSMTNVVLNP